MSLHMFTIIQSRAPHGEQCESGADGREHSGRLRAGAGGVGHSPGQRFGGGTAGGAQQQPRAVPQCISTLVASLRMACTTAARRPPPPPRARGR